MKHCKVCGQEMRAKRYCANHYNQMRAFGKILGQNLYLQKNRLCQFEKCKRQHYAKGYCKKHYAKFIERKNGSPYGDTGKLHHNRLLILLNNPKCEKCLKPAQVIHHKDFNSCNNSLRNLMPLCIKCHLKAHNKLTFRSRLRTAHNRNNSAPAKTSLA